MLDNLKKYKIVLASKSPRRRELLTMLDIPFTINVKENLTEYCPPEVPVKEVAEFLSRQKASAYAADLADDTLVITADTVVILDDRIFGKPGSEAEAVDMLMDLQGRSHVVATGVTLTAADIMESFSVFTEVRFAPISRDEAEWYVKRYRPLDKAGAYGIQEWIGCAAVEGIDGSFYNVMGLPVHQLYHALKKLP